MNIFSKNFKAFKELVVFQPTQAPPPFVVEETEKSGSTTTQEQTRLALEEHEALLRYARRVAITLEKVKNTLAEPAPNEKLASLRAELDALSKQKAHVSPLISTYSLTQDPLDQPVSTSLEENTLALEQLYNLPYNKDLVLRNITIPSSIPIVATLAFIDGLVDNNIISQTILEPLMSLGRENRDLIRGDTAPQIAARYLPSSQVKPAFFLREVTSGLNLGDTAIFFDGAAEALIVETKGQEHRGIDRPALEQSVRGSQAAFSETLRANTGLIRSLLRTNDLVTEILTLGTRSNTLCAVMYLKSVINPALVQEAKFRINSINVDAISESGTLQLFIEDHPMIPYPQALSTERPDRVAAALSEGRLAILVDGASFALVAPISLFTLFHGAEDFSFSWLAASFLRLIRLLGALLTILLPAFYIAINYFHQEALPTDLILTIGGAREMVPFPAIVEILSMEFAFELVREGGIRVPGMLGSTIGIVGAITLGQAAVSAGIVSPITVVIVAVTGLASYAIPDYSLAFSIRLTRITFEILAAMLGLVGLAGGLITIIVLLCGMKSLGVPYLAPVGPKTTPGYDMVIRGPVYSQELRPDELNPKDRRRQSSVARGWTQEAPAGKKDGS
ncbi:MAG: gerAA 1 [Firmicutes bacterium]|nr:gerAA 1 [Bacillota bacterium]